MKYINHDILDFVLNFKNIFAKGTDPLTIVATSPLSINLTILILLQGTIR